MRITVLLFASTRQLIGQSSVTVPFEGGEPVTIRKLIERLSSLYPALQAHLPSVLVAVNNEYADINSGATITEKDEIAIIPPISGG